MAGYEGVIQGVVIDVRFAFSGHVSAVGKKTGDTVKEWEWIASLDKKVLQTELDIDLAGYEKVRADFEIFKKKFGDSDSDDIVKYTRAEKQASLDTSVKQVELAKMHMDQADLVSPVAGVIIRMEGLVVGANITPASSPVTILDSARRTVAFNVPQKDIEAFTKEREVLCRFDPYKKPYKGKTSVVSGGDKGIFTISVTLEDPTGLLPGMIGKVMV